MITGVLGIILLLLSGASILGTVGICPIYYIESSAKVKKSKHTEF